MTAKDIQRMSNDELANLLMTYNCWRRGDCPFEEPDSQPFEPKELGCIIDEAVARLKIKPYESFNYEAFSV